MGNNETVHHASAIETYSKSVQTLETIIRDTTNVDKKGEVEKHLSTALEARSRIQKALEDEHPVNNIMSVFENDDVLVKMGNKLVYEHKINMYRWRGSTGINDSTYWWWYIDHSPISSIFWLMTTLFLFIFSLPFIIDGVNSVSSVMIQIFSTAGIEDFVFDTLPLLGAFFQLGVGGSISLALTRRFRTEFNQFVVKRLLETNARLMLRHILPITSPPIIFSTFILTILVTNLVILPLLGSYYTQQAQNDILRGSVNSATNNISIAMATNLSTYANTLTLIGQEYESIGQNEEAIDAYQQALREDATMLPARYLLANLLLDNGQPQDAIVILDVGIYQLTSHERDELDITVLDNDDSFVIQRLRIQYKYLLLVTRARAFLQLGSARAAMTDLLEVRDLIGENEDLFITPRDLEVEDSTSNLNEQILSLSYHYYYALANEALELEALQFNQTNVASSYRIEAENAWEIVIQLSDERSNDYQARLWNIEANQRLSTVSQR